MDTPPAWYPTERGVNMKQQRRYSPEFRAEAINLATEQGVSQKEASRRLAITKGNLANWMAASKASTHLSTPGARSAADLAAENTRLRKELAEATMERTFQKRGPRTLPGSRCPVRVHEKVATPFPSNDNEPSAQRVP